MRSAWWSPRAIRCHLALLVCLPTFALLGLWQLRRALGGNTLSWAYTFEWPLFAAYACFLWWRLVHEEAGILPRRRRPRNGDEERAAREAHELEEYNAYLAALAAEDERREEDGRRR